MRRKYSKKVVPLLIIGLALLLFGAPRPELTMEQRSYIALAAFLLIGFGLHFWALAKGHEGTYWPLAIFPPLGILILALLRDRHKNAPPEEEMEEPEKPREPEAAKNCPHCGAPYRESDYRPDAVVMICSKCRGVLPH